MSPPAMRVAFPISAELRAEVEAAMDRVRRAEEPSDHAGALSEAVNELIGAGLECYFLRPLDRARVGMVGMNAARLAVASAGHTLPALVRRILGGLSGEQLLVIVDYLEEMLVEIGEPASGSEGRAS